MRILFWSPNYDPEPIGVAPLLTDASRWLAARGHEVDVVTAQPNYPQRRIYDGYDGLVRRERRDGVDIARTWLRVRPQERFIDKALYELSFAATSTNAAAGRVRRADVVVALVPTLLSAASAALLARATRRPFVLWLQDLVVAGARAVDTGPVARAALRATERLELATARAADHVVVCSPGFADDLVERGIDRARISTVLNWVDVEAIHAEAPPTNDPPRFLYAGNLGYSQGFETLVDAAASLGERAHVSIVGEGNAAEHVRALTARLANVDVGPSVPAASFSQLLAAADAHVVVQRRVSAGANLPSKIGPYLASGRPVVASIDADTPAAALLRQSGGALLVPAEAPNELAAAMATLAADPDLRLRLGTRGRAFAERVLARTVALPQLESALLDHVRPRRRS